ncbi:MAG: M48 family metallopeptidase [Bacteroidota bacterium]
MLTVLIVILTAGFILDLVLNIINNRHRVNKLPELLKDIYNNEQYAKSSAYENSNSRLDLISSSFTFIITLVLILTGSFALLEQWTKTISQDMMWSSLLFFGVLFIASDILSLPFSIYKTFVIEERFGFNRTTPSLYIKDKLKGYLLAIFLGGSLFAMFILFYQLTGKSFWIYAWITFSVVSILLSMFYTSFILPMFNKLTPMQPGELREAIEVYCKKAGFKLDNLFIMDGSKRSSRANAFFSGLGARKKIVLFDTLVEKHSKEELVAILAHEVGHYKRKHTRTTLVLSVLQMGLMLFLLSRFIADPAIAAAFGATEPSFALGLLGFTILYTPVSLITSLAMNVLSRKHEYEADAFAATTYHSEPLQTALKKLSADNLSNLTPHPLYVFFHYSHPTLLQRLTALKIYS